MKQILLEDLEKSRKYTLQIAEAMPTESYDFKPTKEVWAFKELIHHIGYGIIWMEANFLRQAKSEWNPPAVGEGKAAVIDYVQKAYGTISATLAATKTVTDDQVKAFYAIMDHTTHHRGQAVLFLRCKGITPPEYPFE